MLLNKENLMCHQSCTMIGIKANSTFHISATEPSYQDGALDVSIITYIYRVISCGTYIIPTPSPSSYNLFTKI